MTFKEERIMTYIKTRLKRDIVIDSVITLHYFEYMKDFIFQGESHDFWEFLYVDKGTVSVRSDDDWLTLNTGDIIFHKPNEFHAIRSIGKNSPNLVAVSFTTESPAISFFCNKSFTLDMQERSLISLIIREARDTFSTPMHIPSVEQVQIKSETPFASEQMILQYLELFLITVCRNHQESAGHAQTLVRRSSPEKEMANETLLDQIIQYMGYHICERLTVSAICEDFSISRSALQTLFHDKEGCGAIDYFNTMKIERAKEIIREGSMNYTEIAYFLSYSSLPYFSKQFKKATGMSPLKYYSSIKGMTEALKKSSTKNRNREIK